MNKPTEYAVLIGVGALAFVGVFLFLKKQGGAVVSGAGGIVSGNNALTEDTPYEGAGIIGTLGAAANSASGGLFQSWGESLGGWFFDISHPDQSGATSIDLE